MEMGSINNTEIRTCRIFGISADWLLGLKVDEYLEWIRAENNKRLPWEE